VRTPSGPTIVLPGRRRVVGAPHEILAVARHWLGREVGVHYRPEVPMFKESIARGVHAAYLPDAEPVLVLYDATLLGTGENGFVVTPERLCWKNLLDHPRQIAWGEIDPGSLIPRIGSVDMAGGSISITGGLASPVAGFLAEMASRCRREPGGPYRHAADAGEAAEDETSAVANLTALARRHLGEGDDLYYYPAIPTTKLREARETHAAHLAADEVVAVLYDDTVFGGAEEGFLITPLRLCWKNLPSLPASLSWDAIDPDRVFGGAGVVHVMGRPVHLTAQSEIAAQVATLVVALAREARRG
jgi:hypothetical protein